MASLLPAHVSTSINLPCKKTKFRPLQVKAQGYSRDHHEGKSSDVIETNLGVLRVRIEEAKKKEKLERCLVAEHGWNYINTLPKKNNTINNNEIIELLRNVGATFGLTILSCSFCLCLASLLLHLNQ